MNINVIGALVAPPGQTSLANTEILFEQTRSSEYVVQGYEFSTITSQDSQYSFFIAPGTYTVKLRYPHDVEYRPVASNVIVLQGMNGYSINKILIEQQGLEQVDQEMLESVLAQRDEAVQAQQVAVQQEQSQVSQSNSQNQSKIQAQASQSSASSSQQQQSQSSSQASASQASAQQSAQEQVQAKDQIIGQVDQQEASQQAQQQSAVTAAQEASKAATQQGQASQSQAQAKASEDSALESKTQAQTSAANQSKDQQQALAHKTSAEASQSQASSSQQSASASQQSQQSSEQAQSSSEQQASASQQGAQISATESQASQQYQDSKQQEQKTQSQSASSSAASAQDSQGQQEAQKTQQKQQELTAVSSSTQAQQSASQALQSQNSAQTSQEQTSQDRAQVQQDTIMSQSNQQSANTSKVQAEDQRTKQQAWQANPEDVPVELGLFSAKHYQLKAQYSAASATGQLVWRGGWSAKAGVPPPIPPNNTQDFYRITEAGIMQGVGYVQGDYLHWDYINLIWFRLGSEESVLSINGKTGIVTLTKQDIGLSLVNNWQAQLTPEDAQADKYATQAQVNQQYTVQLSKLGKLDTAVSQVKLAQQVTINGTQFDGSQDITTQTWGRSIDVQVGEYQTTLNGSQPLSISLLQMGAEAQGTQTALMQAHKQQQDDHEISAVRGLQTTLDSKYSPTNKPSLAQLGAASQQDLTSTNTRVSSLEQWKVDTTQQLGVLSSGLQQVEQSNTQQDLLIADTRLSVQTIQQDLQGVESDLKDIQPASASTIQYIGDLVDTVVETLQSGTKTTKYLYTAGVLNQAVQTLGNIKTTTTFIYDGLGQLVGTNTVEETI